MNEPLTHVDYADAAESAERGAAWPQAAALWKRAAETCDDDRRERYAEAAAQCEARADRRDV